MVQMAKSEIANGKTSIFLSDIEILFDSILEHDT